MKVLAVIPARGGSRGIPQKNIRKFGGLPLIAYAIKQAKASHFIDRVIVSTESQKIAEVAKKFGAEVPFLRPKELAGHESLVKDAIRHLLNALKIAEHYVPDYIVLLQATSPLRNETDLDEAFRKLIGSKADALISVCRTEQLVFTMDKDNYLKLRSDETFLKSTNRQQLPPTYKFDGSMIYIIKTKTFLKEDTFMPRRTIGFEVPRWRAVDLDEPQDFVVGELIFKNRTKITDRINKFR